jgi:large subunit ribosomal protein L22
MDISVKHKFVKVSPSKVRPVLSLIRGKNAERVSISLRFLNKSYAKDLEKLILSGIAAAKEKDIETQKLMIKSLSCDDGPRLKRHRYGSRGRVIRTQKRMCHLGLVLSDLVCDKKIMKKINGVKAEDIKVGDGKKTISVKENKVKK